MTKKKKYIIICIINIKILCRESFIILVLVIQFRYFDYFKTKYYI